MCGKPVNEVRLFAWSLVAAALAVSACGVSSPVSREIGALCEDQDECDDRCLDGARYPGGFCSVTCDDDSDCPERASCADLEGGVCLFTCGDDREGTTCDFLGQAWQCRSEPARGSGEEVMVCTGPG